MPGGDAKIFYTIDGGEPTEKSAPYAKPFTIRETSIVKAVSVNAKGEKSYVAESKLNKMPHDWDVKLFSDIQPPIHGRRRARSD